jgi:hypothetical protein
LIDHLTHGRVAAQLASQRFDHVVLQEQQQWPSFNRGQRQREFETPANTLDVMIRASGARTLLFLTWARREGDRDNRPDDTYELMQARVREGYRDAGLALGAPVVAAGLVWQAALRAQPDLPLFQPDGRHASRHGSYLAACAFFKAFYARSPAGNPYLGDRPQADAPRLQHIAAEATALHEPSEL